MQSAPPSRSSSRISQILGRLSLEAKVAQLSAAGRAYEMDDLFSETGELDSETFAARFPHGVGQVGRMGLDRDPEVARHNCDRIQTNLERNAPEGIGALFNEEGVHGLMARGATVFPAALALAATWDVALIERVYAAVAIEARKRGSNYVYAPVLDLARDPRWGRVEETFGEDAYLVARMGVATVLGLQGRTGYRIDDHHVLACAKHFVAHGIPQGGANSAPVQIGERELRNDHLAPFAAVIAEADVGAIMAAYHEIDGIPMHINQHLLDDVLRAELGFEGIVTSDGFGIPQLETLHRVATDATDAAQQAFEAGVDCEVPQPVGSPGLVERVNTCEMSEAIIDRALSRVLRAKDRLGLLDPFAASAEHPTNEKPNVEADPAHDALSLEVARRGVVLLTNDGSLPLAPSLAEQMAVSGPNAEHAHLGGYCDPGATGTSVLAGLTQRFDTATVLFNEGCRLSDEIVGPVTWWQNEIHRSDPLLDDARIEAAVDAARKADVCIAVIGGNEITHREGWWFDHLGDRSDLKLPGRQDELVKRLAATGTALIAVVISGGPVDLRNVVEHANAVLWTCYPGQRGGEAIAEIIAGDHDAGGRLPVTFPRSVGQVLITTARPSSAGRDYLNESNKALFELGHGLSYTSFELTLGQLTPTEISRAALAAGATVELKAKVTNTGERSGVEHVRLTVDDHIASVSRPRHRLAGFRTVELAAGESEIVSFDLGETDLALLDRSMTRTVEPGTFGIDLHSTSTPPLPAPSRAHESSAVLTVT